MELAQWKRNVPFSITAGIILNNLEKFFYLKYFNCLLKVAQCFARGHLFFVIRVLLVKFYEIGETYLRFSPLGT